MIRQIAHRQQSVFLTFDDGPDPVGTAPVLEVLRKHQAKATFFVIAARLKAHPELGRAILEDGHTIGNHSLDHRYRYYWSGKKRLMEWIRSADRELHSNGTAPVGFRPPAGVLTPSLLKAANELGEPIVLWNERFYDAVFPWNENKARRSAAKLPGGSIVLLHDRQSPARVESFCKTLDTYLACLKHRGLKFEPLTREVCFEARGGFRGRETTIPGGHP